jgi:acyl dehydratase
MEVIHMSTDVYKELKSLIGRLQSEIVGPDEVCRQMIKHFCEAVEDTNPLYTDEGYARNSKYGSIIAPPQMIWTWVMQPLWPPTEQPEIWKQILEVCAKGGFDQIIDPDVEMEFHGPLFPGDRVTSVTELCDVDEEKETNLGRGHFITTEATYKNQKEELICIQRVRFFIYKARGSNNV